VPPAEEKKILPIGLEVVEALAAAVPDQYCALIVFGAGTVVRISEAPGLTLDRIDFLGRQVTIDRQLMRDGGGVPQFGPLKDRKDRPRTIPLPEVVGNALVEHLAQWPVRTSGLIFTNKVGGPIRRTTFSDMWQVAAGPWVSQGETGSTSFGTLTPPC
jgi:integrase